MIMSFTSIRRYLSASFIRSFWQNISDYFKRKLASGSRNVNINEVAIIVSEAKYFAFLVYNKIIGRVDLSSGSRFCRMEYTLVRPMLSLSRLDCIFLVYTIVSFYVRI